MRQSCKLLCISIAELNLESGSVSSEYFLACHRELCGEEKLVLLVWHYPYDESHCPLHCLGVCKQSVSLTFQSLNMELLHTCVVKTLVINLPVNELGTSSLAGPWTSVQISQISIVTEATDEMESEFSNAIHECRCREISVSNYYISHFDEFLAVAFDYSYVGNVVKY